MIYLNIDENGYLLSVSTVGAGIAANIDLGEYDLSGDRIRAHKWENDTLIFDADKYAEIETETAEREAQNAAPTETEQLRADVDYLAIMTGIKL